jgi:TatA/E family protein of Tat protein translocase
MFGLSTGELILIVFILLLLFGSKKIPDLAKSIGEAFHHLKKGVEGEDDKNNRNM